VLPLSGGGGGGGHIGCAATATVGLLTIIVDLASRPEVGAVVRVVSCRVVSCCVVVGILFVVLMVVLMVLYHQYTVRTNCM
jgi:hypothetical protein